MAALLGGNNSSNAATLLHLHTKLTGKNGFHQKHYVTTDKKASMPSRLCKVPQRQEA